MTKNTRNYAYQGNTTIWQNQGTVQFKCTDYQEEQRQEKHKAQNHMTQQNTDLKRKQNIQNTDPGLLYICWHKLFVLGQSMSQE